MGGCSLSAVQRVGAGPLHSETQPAEKVRRTPCAAAPPSHATLGAVGSGEERSAANVAASVVEGRADVAFIPRTVDLGLPLPQTTCPTCAGSVRTCWPPVATQVHGG